MDEYSSVFRGRRIDATTMNTLLNNFCVMQKKLVSGSSARTPKVSTLFALLNRNRSVRQILISTLGLGFANGEKTSMYYHRRLDHPDLNIADDARVERARRYRVLHTKSSLTRQEAKEHQRLDRSYTAVSSWCCAESPETRYSLCGIEGRFALSGNISNVTDFCPPFDPAKVLGDVIFWLKDGVCVEFTEKDWESLRVGHAKL
jgi:hypothetical protein